MKKMIIGLLAILPYLAFTSCGPEPSVPASDSLTAVDLGLPSKTLWADRNLGSSIPSQVGLILAWGESEPKQMYSWENYSLKNKYNETDSLLSLQRRDDPAVKLLGSRWYVPTANQMNELIDYCTWEWTSMQGAQGYLVTSKVNRRWIFLPATGWYENHSLNAENSICNYWTANVYPDERTMAHDLVATQLTGPLVLYSTRSVGIAVRPVTIFK